MKDPTSEVLISCRCPDCGSWALSARLVEPLPGSATSGQELEVTCREDTCSFQATDHPERLIDRLRRWLHDPDECRRLDAVSLHHCGLTLQAERGRAAKPVDQPVEPWP